MKTLTKPVQSRLPYIYGYENDGHWVHDPPNAVVQIGDPVHTVYVTKYYNCEAGGSSCIIGQTKTKTSKWGG